MNDFFSGLIRDQSPTESTIRRRNQIQKIKDLVLAALEDDDEQAAKNLVQWAKGEIPKFPHSRFEDLTGRRFGMLTVISRAKNYPAKGVHWLTHCDCGGATIARSSNLKQGSTQSCGCAKGKRKSLDLGGLSANS